MSLRLRLFLLFSGVLATVLAVGFWGTTMLTRTLSEELGQVAVSVGQSVVSVVDSHAIRHSEVEDSDTSDARIVVERKLVTDDGTEIVSRRTERNGETVTVAVTIDGQTLETLDLDDFDPFSESDSVFVGEIQDQVSDGNIVFLGGNNIRHTIPIPREGFKTAMQGFSTQLALGLAALFLVGLAIAGYLAWRVSKPLQQLRNAAGQVASGQFGATATAGGVREIDETIDAFNAMSNRLSELDAESRQLRANQHLTELGEIGRGLAHSLRNPMNAIGLALDALAAKAGADSASEAIVGDARHQIRRIDEAIRGFLALASTQDSNIEPVNVTLIAREVALEVAQSAHEVRVDVNAEDKVSINAVPQEVRALIHALVINAVEASEAGQTIQLTVLQSENDQVQIRVEDSGTGLNPDVAERLFEPHATTKPHGSGMGLYIAYRLATDRYRGSLSLTNRTDGKGCVAKAVLGNHVQ